MTFEKIESALKQNSTWDLLSKEKLYKRLRADGLTTKKEFDAWWAERKNPVHELYSKPKKTFKFARIAAPPWTYQIDTIRMDRFKRQNKGIDRFLLLVEIESRKAFAYVLKSESVGEVLTAYKRFLRECGHRPFYVQGDAYFNAKEFQKFNDSKHIPVITDIAEEEHVSEGDPLGILDRCVQTLRSMIEKRIHAREDAKWTAWIDEVIHDYNTNPHDTLENQTPNAVYDDLSKIYARWVADSEYNRKVSEQVQAHFKPGNYVRIKLKKNVFDKGATQTMSLEVYRIVSVKGTRITLETYPDAKAVQRAYKPNEVVLVDKPHNAAPSKAIDTAKKQAKQTRKLRSEGLSEPAPEKAKQPERADQMVNPGDMAVVDAEGMDADENQFVLKSKDGRHTGYVYVGIVTKKSAKVIYMKLYKHPDGSNALDQKRITLGSTSHRIDAAAGQTGIHPDALLYVGMPPRQRSDGTMSIPPKVIQDVRDAYVFIPDSRNQR